MAGLAVRNMVTTSSPTNEHQGQDDARSDRRKVGGMVGARRCSEVIQASQNERACGHGERPQPCLTDIRVFPRRFRNSSKVMPRAGGTHEELPYAQRPVRRARKPWPRPTGATAL